MPMLGGARRGRALMVAGKPNPVFSKIITTMPTHEGETIKADPAINPNKLASAARILSLSWFVDDTTLFRNR